MKKYATKIFAVISNVLFVTMFFSIWGIGYLFDEYLSNPKVTILAFNLSILIFVVYKWHRYFVRHNLLILKQFDIKRIVFTLAIVIWFFFQKSSSYNPEIWGLTKLQWFGIGFMILGTVWMFQFISFTKNGIYKPRSFVKTYYSELTSFELTDHTIAYTSSNNERYDAKILNPSQKTKAVILPKMDQIK